jgi:type I restriction enzyme S subunit
LKIVSLFKNIDNLITLQQRKLEKAKALKSAYLSEMFPAEGEREPKRRFAGFTDTWEQRKVGDLTNVASAARVHKEEWASSGVPFFRSSDVVSAYKGNENEKAFISFELYEQLTRVSGKLEKDDILITGGGSIGIPYIVPNNEPLYSKDADLIWVKSTEKFNSRYLYTFFTSPEFRRYLNGISHIGTIAHYTIEQVKETPICLPSIEEQNEIGAYFAHLDNLITLQQRKLEKLQNIKKAYLNEIFI